MISEKTIAITSLCTTTMCKNDCCLWRVMVWSKKRAAECYIAILELNFVCCVGDSNFRGYTLREDMRFCFPKLDFSS
jgi:hypothetical protein